MSFMFAQTTRQRVNLPPPLCRLVLHMGVLPDVIQLGGWYGLSRVNEVSDFSSLAFPASSLSHLETEDCV